jgi:hypothetical protein
MAGVGNALQVVVSVWTEILPVVECKVLGGKDNNEHRR